MATHMIERVPATSRAGAAQLGGHRAVRLMAIHANPIQATNFVSFTIDMTSKAFTLTAFTLLGAAMLALARAAAQPASTTAPGPPTPPSSPRSCSSPPGAALPT